MLNWASGVIGDLVAFSMKVWAAIQTTPWNVDTLAGLGLATIGIVITLLLHRRSSAASRSQQRALQDELGPIKDEMRLRQFERMGATVEIDPTTGHHHIRFAPFRSNIAVPSWLRHVEVSNG